MSPSASALHLRALNSTMAGRIVMPMERLELRTSTSKHCFLQPLDNTASKRTFYTQRVFRRRRPGRRLPPLQTRIAQKSKQLKHFDELCHQHLRGNNDHSSIHQHRSTLMRFLDPWYDLAELCRKDEHLLTDKVDSVTRTFGVVAALMASLSAALLIGGEANWHDHYCIRERESKKTYRSEDDRERSTDEVLEPGHQSPDEYRSHVAQRANVQRQWTATRQQYTAHEWYMGCCAASFYCGMCATALSAVLNAWLAATPPGSVVAFVKGHSKFIATIPALLGASTILSGSALCLGLSEHHHGAPLAYVGIGGTTLCCGLVGLATGKGWYSTYRLISMQLKGRQHRHNSKVASAFAQHPKVHS